MDALSAGPATGDGVVTQECFQSIVARLVSDPEFRDSVRAHGIPAPDGELTTLEQERVISIARGRGIDAARTLHKSFRLTKIYTMMPLTRALLGPDRLATEISSFWKAKLPVSHYFIEEAIAFCDFLRDRICSGLQIKYLEEIVAYERANLELRRARTDDDVAKPQYIRFDHDPVTLFTQLMNGESLQDIPPLACLLIGSLNQNGEVQWQISTDEY
ncbi:MAG: hypothetical protein WBV94_19480 [Blastocatellia bacterium]